MNLDAGAMVEAISDLLRRGWAARLFESKQMVTT